MILAALTVLAAQAAPTSLTDAMPPGVVLYVEAPGIAPILDEGLAHPLVQGALRQPLVAAAISALPVTPEAGIAFIDGLTGRDVLGTLAELSKHGIALGVEARDGEPRVILLVEGEDEELLEEVLDEALGLLTTHRGVPARLIERAHSTEDGVDVWRFGDDFALARDGALLVLANHPGTMDAALASIRDSGDGLAADPRFSAARDAGGANAFAWGWIDLDALDDQEDREGIDNLRAIAAQPAPHFLLGPIVTHLGRAGHAGFELRLDTNGLAVDVDAFEVDLGAGVTTLPGVHAKAPLLPRAVAGESARGVFYRDMAAVARARTEMFPNDVQPAFAKALSEFALFFGGADVYEDVLPHVSPWFGVVVRDARFDEGLTPDIPLPSVCLVARVAREAEMGPRLVGAFQTLISLINVDAAQQGRASQVLGLGMVDGVTVTSARYPAPAEGDGVDVRYNLVPACAMVGDAFVLGTHASVVEDVVRQLQSGATSSFESESDTLHVRGASLGELIAANRETIVLQSMLNEGKSRAQAELETDGLVHLLRGVDRFDLATSRPAQDRLELTLHAQFAKGETK